MHKYILIAASFFFTFLQVQAQEKITTEKIWRDYTFYADYVPGFNFMNDGKHYTRLEDNAIKQYDITSGAFTGMSIMGDSLDIDGDISAYEFNRDESKIIIQTQQESIYRRSSKAYHYVYDVSKKQTFPIRKERISSASLNNQGDKVAYIYENNIYYFDLRTKKTTQVTDDGKKNAIINGMADWVYEEEFGQVQYYEWSPSGGEIGYIRFDEQEVPSFTMTNYSNDLYPSYQTFKYPKVGEKNAVVTAHIYALRNKRTRNIDTGADTDIYLPRIKWTPQNELIIFHLNRHQNHLQLLKADRMSGKSSVLLDEKNKYYINIHDNMTFLKDGSGFIWTSEKDGFNHIYLYDLKGKEKRQITKGDYEVKTFYGMDEDRSTLFYQSNEDGALYSNVYAIGMDGKNKRKLSPEQGSNRAQFSDTYDYYVLNHSTANTAPTYQVYNRQGKVVRTIVDNAGMKSLQDLFQTVPVEFTTVPLEDGLELNAFMLKPHDFDKTKSYPLMMVQYSGPGSQTVLDTWKGNSYWWYQQMVQEGFIVVGVDPRGTGGRGEEFAKMTYQQLGHYETIDQIASAKYLASKPYIDADRIGIFGWSYGGYMSSLAILKGNDVFNTAIAVAPVTNWKWYDTVYTERYMRTTEENEDGYKENSPVYFADQLKGNYLLIHGMSDDNVHFQNSVEMAEALIRANKQFDTYFYPNRNHGIYGNNARLHLYTKIHDFIKEHLAKPQP